MVAASRIYVIAPRVAEDGKPIARRLVRATNAAQALRHVADEFLVAVASQDDLVVLTTAGVKVEDSSPTPAAG